MDLRPVQIVRFAGMSTLILVFAANLCSGLSASAHSQKLAKKGNRSVPSTAAAKAVLEQRGKREGLFTVKSFRRLDGYSRGPGVYTIEFEAVVQCLKDGGMLVAAGNPACGEAGQIVRYSSAFALQKTERGWKAVLWASDAKLGY